MGRKVGGATAPAGAGFANAAGAGAAATNAAFAIGSGRVLCHVRSDEGFSV